MGDRWFVAQSYSLLGLVNWQLARFDEARRCSEAALSNLAALGDRRAQVPVYLGLGFIAPAYGELELAEKCHRQALAICRQVGDRPFLINCYADLSTILRFRGKLGKARRSAQESVDLSVEYGFRFGVDFQGVPEPGVTGTGHTRFLQIFVAGFNPNQLAIPNRNCVVLSKSMSGRRRVLGNCGLFGESGKCWVSRQNP